MNGTGKFDPVKDFKTDWISKRIDNDCIEYADEFGKYLCDLRGNAAGDNALTNSQIRNVFGEIKRIQQIVNGNADKFEEQETAFLLLRPKLAYAEARVVAKNKTSTIQAFKSVLEQAHHAVFNVDEKDKEVKKKIIRFQNFVDLTEAILAYHKSYGGKKVLK